MSDLMTGVSGYATGAIDVATTQIDQDPNPLKGEADAAKVNGLAAAILQIQAILGIGPSLKGTRQDLVERLSIGINASGTIKADSTAAFSGQIIPELGANPTGAVIPYAGTTSPNGYLLCDGSAVSRTTYSTLFNTIGITYGSGDGSTTFNVPDIRGRAVIMVDGAANRITSASTGGVNADTLGGVGGAETHTLTIAQMPSHDHAQDGSTTLTGGAAGTFGDGVGAGTTGGTTATTGGGAAHNNTQPWIALNYIIKT
jgi:microcystin-dependent protein